MIIFVAIGVKWRRKPGKVANPFALWVQRTRWYLNASREDQEHSVQQIERVGSVIHKEDFAIHRP